MSYLLAAVLGLFFVRGAVGAVLLTSLGVVSLATGVAALLGPRLRRRTTSTTTAPAEQGWVTAVGVGLVAMGLVLGAIGMIDVVEWAAER